MHSCSEWSTSPALHQQAIAETVRTEAQSDIDTAKALDASIVTISPQLPGGVLIMGDGGLLGAVGVSGDTSDNDEICALAGIEAAGLKANAG